MSPILPTPPGAKPPGPRADDGFVDLLLACHARIRRYAAAAVALAEGREADPRREAETARAVARYFREGLPLHAADEDEALVPTVAGRDPELDAALAVMGRQHREHRPMLAALLAALDALAAAPGQAAAREALRAVAEPLQAELEAHLAHEEAAILPRLGALLTREEDAALVAALRARRSGG